MKILILGNGVMANVLKDCIGKEDDFVAMLDTKDDIVCDKDFDVIIDFSNHKATKKVIDFAVSKNKPILIATTGQTNEELEYIEKNSYKIKILKISNTSLGVYVMKELVKTAANILKDFDIAIEEVHHTRKIDSPSGTALSLKESIREVSDKDIQMNSLRLSNVAGIHKVTFAGLDEMIEIKHTAVSRKIFALGAIKYAKDLIGR